MEHNEKFKFILKQRKARYLVNREIKRGNLIRAKVCCVCRIKGPMIAHHPDYDEPLEVMFVCLPCHYQEHKKMDPDFPHNIKKGLENEW